MEKEEPKKSRKNFYLGIVFGFITVGIINKIIWPMLFD
jgi:hypothetical protein